MPPAPPSLLSASHSVTAAAVLRKGERATREKRERNEAKRERAGKNELGFSSEARCVEFYSKRNARVTVGSGRTAEIERASVTAQAGARSFAGLGPHCGLGAACAHAE